MRWYDWSLVALDSALHLGGGRLRRCDVYAVVLARATDWCSIILAHDIRWRGWGFALISATDR